MSGLCPFMDERPFFFGFTAGSLKVKINVI